MARPNESYQTIVVESYEETHTGGLHGKVHIRPAPDQQVPQSVRVECPREMRDTERYPLGTRFRIKAKLTDRNGGEPFLYSHHSWHYQVL